LTAKVAALRDCLDTAQKQVAMHVVKLDGLNRTEANIAFVTSEVTGVGELWTDIATFKDWTSWIRSLIVPQCPPFFE
jgi:glycerol-3-phosphate responsive antiterminator